MEQMPGDKRRGRVPIILSIVTSALGYLGLLTVIVDAALNGIYGHSSHGPKPEQISRWLAGIWFFATFLAVVTVPVSFVVAIVTTFLRVAQRSKLIVWIVTVGGALGWLVA